MQCSACTKQLWRRHVVQPTNHGRRCEQARLNGLLGSRPSSCMAKSMRLCTGFRPSRTSGSARPTITDIAYCSPNNGFCECKTTRDCNTSNALPMMTDIAHCSITAASVYAVDTCSRQRV